MQKLSMNKRFYISAHLFALCAFFVLLVGCATKPPSYAPVDYTNAYLFSLEIKDIRDSAEKDPVKALWRAKILLDRVSGKDPSVRRTSGTEGSNVSAPDNGANVSAEPGTDVSAAASTAAEAEALFRFVADKTRTLFRECAEKEKWNEAWFLFQSLAVLGEAPSGWTAEELSLKQGAFALFFPDSVKVPDTADANPPPPAKVSQMIRGTVTIWVDRGLRVEKGVGYPERVIGSGFFIDKRGYIITNHHVISSEVDPSYEGYSRLFIKLADDPDTRIPARVIGWDPVFDLALLKVEVEAPYVFTLGSSADLDVGDKIYAIGSPVGLERTLTSGIVSAVDRRLFPMGSVLQIDAAINAGNSGGPIIDQNGAVQAVVFAGIAYYEGLNFAIPIEYLKLELPRLYEGGKVSHGWSGSYGRTYKDAGGKAGGVEVFYVMPASSASAAGLRPETVITAVNGVPVSTIEELQAVLLSILPGSIVRFTSSDSGDYFIYLNERPENPGLDIYQGDIIERSFVPIFGMSMVQTSGGFKKKYGITSIIRGSAADESGFSVNDPVQIEKMLLSPDKDALYVEIYAKKRKNGFLDAFLALAAPLDSPWYF